MIQRLSHTCILVHDQDQAYEFYVNKLGLEVRTDAKMDGFRWLTVGPKAQPELEIALMLIAVSPQMDETSCSQLRELVKNGMLPGGVFDTADCQKTYDELKAKGVEFLTPPTDRFYGIEAVMKDPFGNRFSVTQPKS